MDANTVFIIVVTSFMAIGVFGGYLIGRIGTEITYRKESVMLKDLLSKYQAHEILLKQVQHEAEQTNRRTQLALDDFLVVRNLYPHHTLVNGVTADHEIVQILTTRLPLDKTIEFINLVNAAQPLSPWVKPTLDMHLKARLNANTPPTASSVSEDMLFDWANAPLSWQLSFQDPATTMMDGIVHLHHDIMLFLSIILFFVLTLLVAVVVLFVEKRITLNAAFDVVNWKVRRFPRGLSVQKFHTGHGVTHHTTLETVWTIIPTLILLTIATPSFALIYGLDEVVTPQVTLRIVGHQWYWTYDFIDEYLVRDGKQLTTSAAGGVTSVSSAASYVLPPFGFNSYMVLTDDLPKGGLRLLETDMDLVLPIHTNIRLLVTSADVIHSWAVPAFGIKIDAVPGRTNEYYLNAKRFGIFYGQCSEICGVNHGFMPIKVRIVDTFDFINWYRSNVENLVK